MIYLKMLIIFFYEKRLIKGQVVGTRYHYYDVKTGEFVEEFTQDIDVEIIGEKELYLDHSSTFCKFI